MKKIHKGTEKRAQRLITIDVCMSANSAIILSQKLHFHNRNLGCLWHRTSLLSSSALLLPWNNAMKAFSIKVPCTQAILIFLSLSLLDKTNKQTRLESTWCDFHIDEMCTIFNWSVQVSIWTRDTMVFILMLQCCSKCFVNYLNKTLNRMTFTIL